MGGIYAASTVAESSRVVVLGQTFHRRVYAMYAAQTWMRLAFACVRVVDEERICV